MVYANTKEVEEAKKDLEVKACSNNLWKRTKRKTNFDQSKNSICIWEVVATSLYFLHIFMLTNFNSRMYVHIYWYTLLVSHGWMFIWFILSFIGAKIAWGLEAWNIFDGISNESKQRDSRISHISSLKFYSRPFFYFWR